MVVNDLAALKTNWRVWWSTLHQEGTLVPADAPYESLRKPGKNGFLLVMMTLAWWGNACADSQWRRTVREVAEALQSLRPAAYTILPPQSSTAGKKGKGGSQKRKRSEEDDGKGEVAPAGRPTRKSK